MTKKVPTMTEPIIQFFKYDHLPPKLQEVSRRFWALAVVMVEELPRNPERTVALRHLLDAKDAAVRKYLFYIMSGAAFTSGIGWFAANIDTVSAVNKFRAVMALDDRHIPGDAALVGYEHLRKYYVSIKDNEGFFFTVKKKVECCSYPRDYREFSQFLMNGISAEKQRGYYDWVFGDLLQKIDSLGRLRNDSYAMMQRNEYIELQFENIIDCSALPERDGLGVAYARGRLRLLEPRTPGNPVVQFVNAQLNSDSVGDNSAPELLRDAASAVQSSARLLTIIGQMMMRKDEFTDAAAAFERAHEIDPNDCRSLVLQAGAAIQCVPQNLEKARMALETYFSDPNVNDTLRMKPADKEFRKTAEKIFRYVKGNIWK